jgi:hypothetical protein
MGHSRQVEWWGGGREIGKRTERMEGTEREYLLRVWERKSHSPQLWQCVGTGVYPASTCCPRCLLGDVIACQPHTFGLCFQFCFNPGPNFQGSRHRASEAQAHHVSSSTHTPPV